MKVQLDHVVISVSDLDAVADRLLRDHGLASVAGGRHDGHGTANRIVPLGDSYLELVTVVDPEEAAGSAFGRFVGERMGSEPSVDGLCVRTDSIDRVCRRLGLTATPMGRVTPDGKKLSWRLAGLERALDEGLPFFIQWEVPADELPARSAADHQVDVVEMRATAGGDVELLSGWLGSVEQVAVVSQPPGFAVTVVTSGGVVDLPAALSSEG